MPRRRTGARACGAERDHDEGQETPRSAPIAKSCRRRRPLGRWTFTLPTYPRTSHGQRDVSERPSKIARVRPGWAPDVLSLFLDLAAIPSPPGEERAVADRVLEYLEALGLEADEDDAGPKVGSQIGNILARGEPSGAAGTPLFFWAPLDAVPLEGPPEPVVGEDGVVRNAGGTILGADNKAAVAAMLEGVRRVLAERRPHAGVELVFTAKEEVGLRGAGAFRHERLEAEVGFVYD